MSKNNGSQLKLTTLLIFCVIMKITYYITLTKNTLYKSNYILPYCSVQVEKQMIKSLKDIIEKCVDAYIACGDDETKFTKWILDWPGQVCLLPMYIFLTAVVTPSKNQELSYLYAHPGSPKVSDLEAFF